MPGIPGPSYLAHTDMPPDTPNAIEHEFRLDALEKSHERLQDTLSAIAEEIRKLATAMTLQAEDREALKRAFRQIDGLQREVQGVKQAVADAETARLQRETAQAQRELAAVQATRRGMYSEILKIVAIVVASVTLSHWGISLVHGG
jgi:chromosome segregation ATPase